MKIGTRGSDLALWQARYTQAMLAEKAGVEAELVIMDSKGDRDKVQSLSALGDIGAFTREIEAALLEGKVDLAVHSHKDLPTESPEGLVVAAVPPRGPVRDVLAIRPEAHDPEAPGLPLRRGSVVGTGSARRRCQLLARRPDLEIADLRGNVPTRLDKLTREHPGEWNYDAIVLAEAGLVRLAIDPSPMITVALPADDFLPAPAQGALALQVRESDVLDPASPMSLAMAALHDAETAAAVAAERGVLAALPGGCNLPLGCMAQVRQDGIFLQATLERSGRGLVRAEALADDPAAASAAVLSQLLAGESAGNPSEE